jgi:hypothetical protein
VAVAAFGDFSMVNLFLFCFFFLYSPPHIFFSSLVGAAEAAKVAAEGALVGWFYAVVLALPGF